ncbi:MAG: hypothetical protein HQ477_09260 [Chloroflexi bacterium]|nr:hypothetical protein [Chloroflexota bacterium]
MSKISDRLNKLGHTERSGFGFGARAVSIKIPVILVAVSIDKASDSNGLTADLFILGADSKGAAQTTPVTNAEIWGVSVLGGSAKEIDAAVKEGADFVIIESDLAPGAALRDDSTAKGFVVGLNVTEDRSKAIDSGPFDFLVVNGLDIELPLNVGSVLDVQEQLARYSNHIFLRVKEIPDQISLELLRDIGISALIYEAKTVTDSDLTALREAIDQLEPKKQKSQGGATLPRTSDLFSQDDDDDDNEDEFEDEDWV